MPPPSTGHRASRRARIALALGAVALALLVGEGVCRVRAHWIDQGALDVAFDNYVAPADGGRVALIDIIRMSRNEKIVFELKPGMKDVPFKGKPLSTNRFGFRGPEIEVEPGPNTITIVGLGDSVMFGWGVGDGQPYPALLEKRLQQRYPAKDWRVINMAVPAYNTVMEVETLREKGLQFAPDLVILNLVMNDLELPQYLRMVDDVLDPRRSYLLEWIRTRLSGTPARGGEGVDAREGRDPRLGRSDSADAESRVPERYRQLRGWEPFHRALDDLKSLAQERGFTVVTFSTTEDEVEVALIQAALERGFLHIRLFPEIQAYLKKHHNAEFSVQDPKPYLKSALAVTPDDGHPSPLQHQMAAEKLLSRLDREGVLANLMH